MARKLDERLAEVVALRDAPHTPAAKNTLRAALGSSTGVLVAAAVSVVREGDLEELLSELSPAFSRLLERPVKRDPGCRGKVAIARCLHDRDHWDDSVFVAGVRHVQPEPVWGGTEDSAAELRGVCGFAYAHAGHPDTLRVLAELLADPERTARAAAARALGDAGRADADALVRYKILCGDDEPEVLTACYSALLSLEGDAALEFVERRLSVAGEAENEAAILALGESRLAAAEPLLIEWSDAAMTDDLQRVGYLAVALLRSESATQHLLDTIATGSPNRALHAVAALSTFRADKALAARVLAAAEGADPSVAAEAWDRFAVP